MGLCWASLSLKSAVRLPSYFILRSTKLAVKLVDNFLFVSRGGQTHLNNKYLWKSIFMFATSLARGKNSRASRSYGVFCSFSDAKKVIISALLPWISSVLSRLRLFQRGCWFQWFTWAPKSRIGSITLLQLIF